METIQEQLTANLISPASAFELSYTPAPNTLMVFTNGVYQRINTDYAQANNTIIFQEVVPTTYDVRAAYQYTASTPASSIADPECPYPTPDPIHIQETLVDNLVFPTSTFQLTQTPDENSYFIFLNGIVQRDTTDYTLSGNILTTNSVIPTSYNVFADYDYTFAVEHDPVIPRGRAGSTTINHAITSFELLAERIKMQLGYPVVRIELCDDQIYDFIDQAVEWFSKYAGYTEEYLMFDASRVYKAGLGVKMDELFSRYYMWQCTGDEDHLRQVTTQFYDCDMNAYRKVIDVFSVDPVASTGTDVLFSLDYMFAQQTYFNTMMGSFGFDLTTWHILKEWLDLRKKMFATDPYFRFDKRTQYMRLIPEPTRGRSYMGVVGCYVEKSISQIVVENWVFRFSLALTKIALAHTRGKFGQVQLFGGGGPNGQDLMTQGITERDKLIEELMNAGDAFPINMYIG